MIELRWKGWKKVCSKSKMGNVITGLDVGSAQIKGVVVCSKKDGALSVVSVFKKPSVGFRKGVIVDIEEATKSLRDVVLELQKISKESSKNIFINVNGEHIKIRPSRGVAAVARADWEIQDEDVDRAIQAAGAVKNSPNHLVLHHVIREFFIDDIGDILSPIGMTGNRLEVDTVIIEAFAPHVNLLLKCLRHAGADVGGLIFNSLASSRAVLSKQAKNLGVLMIDFGFGTTNLAVYEENKIRHAKSLPIGAGYLTNDIAIGLKTSLDVAEKLKLTYGYALAKDVSRREMIKLSEFEDANQNEISRRFISEIIEVRLEELLDLIHNELKSISGSPQLPAGTVITGAGAKLPGMVELVREKLKLPVQIGLPDLGDFEVLNPVHREMLEDPEFGTAVGLVLSGLHKKKKFFGRFGFVKKILAKIMP